MPNQPPMPYRLGTAVFVDTAHGRQVGVVLAAHHQAFSNEWDGFPHPLPPSHYCVMVNDVVALAAYSGEYLEGIWKFQLAKLCRAVPWQHMTVAGNLSAEEVAQVHKLQAALPGLSVMVRDDFEVDGRHFYSGQVGQIRTFSLGLGGSAAIARIRWPDPDNGAFDWDIRLNHTKLVLCHPERDFYFEPSISKEKTENTQNLVVGEIRMVHTHRSRPTMSRTYPAGAPVQIQPGDLVEVVSMPPGTLVLKVLIGTNRIQAGTLLRPGHCPTKPLAHPFFNLGWQVQVGENVRFRQKNLEGMTGKVLLHTDLEGDVGVEFSVDLGAGSLEGLGKDGHCLFIPASHLKKLAE